MFCKKCQKNNFTYQTKSEIRGNKKTKWIVATCECGEIIEFGYKTKPYSEKNEAKAHYKFKGGKHLLKMGKSFVAVCIAKNKKGAWKIMPIDEIEKGWELLHT